MSWFLENKARLSYIGGAVIFIIGLITLPDDLDTWGNRLRDVWESAGDNPIAAGAIVAGLILIGLGNWDRLSRPFLSKKRWRSDKELETELRDWLTEAGFTLEVRPLTPEIAKEASFVFAAKMLKRPVTVVRPLNAPGIRLQCLVKPDPPHDAVIGAMDPDERSSLNEELGIELARFGLGFSLEDVLGLGVVIDYPILVTDTLTKWQFVDRVNFVVRAILLVQLIVTRRVRVAQKNASATITPVPLSTPDTEVPGQLSEP